MTSFKHLHRHVLKKRFHAVIVITLSLFLLLLEFQNGYWSNESYFRTLMSPADKKSSLYTLKTFTELMDAINVTYVMCGGTLIGSYRHHGYIPWDDDLDIMINGSQRHLIRPAVQRLAPKFKLITKGPLDSPPWKFYLDTAHSILLYPWKWPFVDIIFFQENNTHIWDETNTLYTFKKSVVFPIIRRHFETLILWSPCNPNLFLQQNYDLNQCQWPSYSHALELSIFMSVRIVPCEQLSNLHAFVNRSTTSDGIKENLQIAGWTVGTFLSKEGCLDNS